MPSSHAELDLWSAPVALHTRPICLYTLDWLSELWSALYLSPERTTGILAAQAEWQTRLLPAAADQMAAYATSCRHGDITRPLQIRPRQ